jgi:hypothetical protein
MPGYAYMRYLPRQSECDEHLQPCRYKESKMQNPLDTIMFMLLTYAALKALGWPL